MTTFTDEQIYELLHRLTVMGPRYLIGDDIALGQEIAARGYADYREERLTEQSAENDVLVLTLITPTGNAFRERIYIENRIKAGTLPESARIIPKSDGQEETHQVDSGFDFQENPK